MALKQDPLDTAVRIDDVGDDSPLAGTVRKSGAHITRDDQDEFVSELKEYEDGVRLADDEFSDTAVGLLAEDPDDDERIVFDEDGNIVKKKPKKKKTTDEDDEFADDEDEDEIVLLGEDEK